ncbi:MAG TPA: hypothetical protein VHL78_05270 [Actinomycetota bacterium]|nr:hypothetical protein [Actinomycetota bacterium]
MDARGSSASAEPRRRILRGLLAASILVTAIHFADNAIFIEDYPQPDYITVPLIVATWIGWTAAAIGAYVLYRRDERSWVAHALLLVYAYAGLSTLGHYLYGSPSELPLWRNVSIVADGVAGFSILAFTLWSAVRGRRRPAPA